MNKQVTTLIAGIAAALWISFGIGSVLVSALIGLATLFLIATLINLFQLLICLINLNCSCRE